MDASASPEVDTDFSKVCGFFFKIENATFPSTLKQNNTIIKYTKLPDFDFDSKVSWSRNSYTLPPRLRKIISLDDQDMQTSRSLQNDFGTPRKIQSSSFTKRKIVTIAEDDENTLHTKNVSREEKRSTISCPTNSAVATDHVIQEKETSQRAVSRLSSSKTAWIPRPSAKTYSYNNNKDLSPSKTACRNKYSNVSIQTAQINSRNRGNLIRERETTRKSNILNPSPKININTKLSPPIEKEFERNKLPENWKSSSSPKKPSSPKPSRTPHQQNKSKVTILKEIKSRDKPVTMIHVPLVEKSHTRNITGKERESRQVSTATTQPPLPPEVVHRVDCGTNVNIDVKDISIETDSHVTKMDKDTETEKIDLSLCNSDLRRNALKEFDSLEIPNITLTKDKSDIPKENTVSFRSHSLPNLNVPALKITPHKDEIKRICNSTSYVIGRATLTYTTRQKINFHVVGENEQTVSDLSSSPLAYPMNVVSVFKKEIKNKDINYVTAKDNIHREKEQSNSENTKPVGEIESLNCSYAIESGKLVKPSDIISTIRVNNDLLQSDYICEQFQRELNFIDSFFESLQYLESCSLSDKSFKDHKVENWVSHSGFDVKTSEYDSFFSKLQNSTDNEDTETMASKSLCLLNLLIRDEQRRAKNLLFVLKMREDALKDFTKSQILWLENKKKQDNTDISTLKKKQRGALLKLQHECGEMQRMRKALLALSEKRKVALMKTKKNIELKLKNNVSVDQIILGKKKLKRNIATDRNVAPLKCFDLSSSGCDESHMISTTSRPKSDTVLVAPKVSAIVRSAEKCIQTGDSSLGTVVIDQATDTAAENFVVVDGSYLNILFQNLSLPQIFSSGKQYEVNEEALKNIVISTNTHHSSLSECDVVEKFMDQIKNCDLDKSSTPSTARSLVEEFDQYYKGLAEEEKSLIDSVDQDYNTTPEIKHVLLAESEQEQYINRSFKSTFTMTNDSADVLLATPHHTSGVDQSCTCENSMVSIETQSIGQDAASIATQAGPLPVPAGATADAEPTAVDIPVSLTSKSSTASTPSDCSTSSPPPCSVSSVSSLASPVHCEAAELRRQQLAIEREIKALEQQQCQLLVVREIPDKPPPPYTPPTESRTHKPPRMFAVDPSVEEKIYKYMTDSSSSVVDLTDPIELFINEFCQETIEKQNSEQSDKPWDACNLLPQKPQVDLETLVRKASTELKGILTGVQPTVVTGVGARRSDHIDDILFTEWRRCEPEWTALHTDEAIVKNQIFESIFQKILTETVDEYKKTIPVENNQVE